ncbi:MAG: 4-alpha-glucanotransferase [Paludibacteraceae bacterium]|nr:4-alpha-glucanotransferase [Paludibacteraceae bacterium]MBR1481300.1 4-alpha-glucanotransferase [Paludibacteraceae bacterium]
MEITFSINYRAQWGQELCLIETRESILGWSEAHPLVLTCHGEDYWTAVVQVSDFAGSIQYKYAIRLSDGGYIYEAGEPREMALRMADRKLEVHDYWQAVDYEKSFYTTAFLKALFRRPEKTLFEVPSAGKRSKRGNVRLSIDLPQILPSQGVAVMGNVPELGNWNASEKLVLSDAHFPIWTGDIEVAPDQVVEYKYVIYDLFSGAIVDMEWGENRHIWGIRKGVKIEQHDRSFRRTQPRFKGAGVAVPVFSLRTEEGFGIGEFQDLKKLADWAAMTGQKMIQTLPINDTTLTHTNLDSYPYNAVSVFALHPIYINIEKMGRLTPAQKKKYEATKAEFNAKSIADYQCVYDEKTKYFKAIYKADKDSLFGSTEYKEFFAKNKEWLEPYAEFLHKRDKQPKDYYYFLQFHADRQLADAVAYAHSVGVAMKGDIPIGISPDSVDAHTDPQLFHLDASAGAPPDDFDARGQNWGFPTYNWDVMAQDNYLWWRRRFQKMQDYFDAYRIDHILGFFRIWQMRKSDVWGLCGHFSPAMPYSLQDLWNMGVQLDEDRMTKPYIRSNFLGDVFGYDTEYAKEHFLNTNDGYIYWFKDEFDTQKKVQQWFESQGLTDDKSKNLMNGLLYLHCEVLFVRDQTRPELLHPRISIYQSHSFTELYDDQKQVLMNIYNDYFFRRHTEFWRQSAMRKLPTLIGATHMLVCGEDLGMVPACVPQVMHELQILSLEIQRMPKDPTVQFAHPADAPYLSVCTTGTHDTNPLRAWWEEDREVTQRFYNDQMGWWGDAPKEMTPEIAEFIVNQHMYSPAMWVILPLQDWFAIDGEVRLADAHAERINLPSNPRHFWNWRMHLSIEELLKKDAFNAHVRRLTSVR